MIKKKWDTKFLEIKYNKKVHIILGSRYVLLKLINHKELFEKKNKGINVIVLTILINKITFLFDLKL